MSDALSLFTKRHASYARFIQLVLYPQGIRAFFQHCRLLGADQKVLDAGCGTGVVSLALRQAMLRRGLTPGPIHAFDLTPAMIERFRQTLTAHNIGGVQIVEANVLRLDALPEGWTNYDLIVSASMLEYVARDQLPEALRGLRERLAPEGRLILFITRRNWFTQLLIGQWWRSNLYNGEELREAFKRAGFSRFQFRRFPLIASYLTLWGHVIEAEK